MVKRAYIWTFLGGFLAMTLTLALADIKILQVMAAFLAVVAFIATGVLWQQERQNREEEAILDILNEYVRR